MSWMIGLAIAVLGGLILFCMGCKGRRVGSLPFCKKCGFDLRGRPEGSDRCAECGSELTTTGAIIIGQRRRRKSLIWSGLLLIFLAGLPLGMMGYVTARRIDVIRYVPLWILERQIASTTPNEKAGAEIERRVKEKELAGAKLEGLVDRVLAVHGDEKGAWNRCYDGIILDAAGALTDAQLERLYCDCYEEQVECKARVRRRFKARFYARGRPEIPGLSWTIKANRSAVTVGNVEIAEADAHSQVPQENFHEFDWIYDGPNLPLGAQNLKYTLEYNVALESPVPSRTVTFRRDMRVPLEVVAQDQAADEWVEDPDMEKDVMRSLPSAKLEADGADMVLQLRVNKPGINLAMELESEELGWTSGMGNNLLVEKNAEELVKVWRVWGKKLNGPVTLNLIPSQMVADDMFPRVERFWGKGVAFRDMKVEHFDKAPYFNMDESWRPKVEGSVMANIARRPDGTAVLSVRFRTTLIDLQYALTIRRGQEEFTGKMMYGNVMGWHSALKSHMGGGGWSISEKDIGTGIKLVTGEKLDIILRPYLQADYDPAKPPWGGEVVMKGLVVP